MIIYSGFWAGFASGVMVGFIALIILSIIVNCFENKAVAEKAKWLNSLNEAAKELIKEMDNESDS